MKYPSLFSQVIDGTDCSCIAICHKDTKVSGYLLQGKQPYGYISHGGVLESWTWNGLSIIGENRCVIFDKLPLFPFTDLFSARKRDALTYTRELALALSRMDDDFVATESGIIPLWRLYGLEDGGILIFPQALGDLISSCALEEVQKANFSNWMHYDIHPPFSLCDELTQFLYAAATGFPPFADPNTKEDKCNAIPLALLDSDIPTATRDFIDDTLHMRLTAQRDTAGNQASQHALTWFLEKTQRLIWNAEPKIYTDAPKAQEFIAKQQKRATRRIFWRKKGWIVATVFASALLIGYFAGSRIKTILTPPYTFGMGDDAIIQEYYKGQTELDLTKMEASFASHTKNPAEMEVSNLFVTRQTRKAYEGIDSIIDVNKWIEEGSPALYEGSSLYGISDETITQIDQDTYEATSTIWTPYPYEETTETDTEEKPAGHTLVYRYEQTQRFSLTTNKKGWRLIGKIENVSVRALGSLEVETKPVPSKIPGQTQSPSSAGAQTN